MDCVLFSILVHSFLSSVQAKQVDANSSDNTAYDALVLVLIQTFGVIALGYFAGHFKVLSEPQAKGLGSYVTKYALPAIFFRVLVTIDFKDVCWTFILAVSISKLIAFLIGLLFTLLFTRHVNLGVAAIVAMFVSQSNDVALAYPLLKSLYPSLASYIYLFAPTQLVILNPFAYFLLEWHRFQQLTTACHHSSVQSEGLLNNDVTSDFNTDNKNVVGKFQNCIKSCLRSYQCRKFFNVLWNVLKNPLFFMTLIGVIFNFILDHHLPTYIDCLLKIIGDSFSATALFSLGYGMVNKMNRIKHKEVYILLAILLTKLVLLPFITRGIVARMLPDPLNNNTTNYSAFAFLYGSTPTAPPVYIFAAEYGVIPETIGAGLVLGTFLCAPIMFFMSHILLMYVTNESSYNAILQNTLFHLSWISTLCCLWTLVELIINKKIYRIPMKFTTCYLMCVLITSLCFWVGHLVGWIKDSQLLQSDSLMYIPPIEVPSNITTRRWSPYVYIVVYYVGSIGALVWVSIISIVIFIERAYSSRIVKLYERWIYLVGFVAPLFVTGIFVLTTITNWQRTTFLTSLDPFYLRNANDLIINLIVLILCTSVTLSFLVAFIRHGQVQLPRNIETPDNSEMVLCDTSTTSAQESITESPLAQVCLEMDEQSRMMACGSTHHIASTQSQQLVHRRTSQAVSIQISSMCDSPPESVHAYGDNSDQLIVKNDIQLCEQCNSQRSNKCVKTISHYTYEFGPGINSTPANSIISTALNVNDDGNHHHAVIDASDKPAHHKHIILLIVSLLTMFFGICLCMWRMVHDTPTGIYLVLEFLYGALICGKGIILLALFGLEIDVLIQPIKKFFTDNFRRFTSYVFNYGHPLSGKNDASPGNVVLMNHIVHQFVRFHLEPCSSRIGKCVRRESVIHHGVFAQYSLEEWLKNAGVTEPITLTAKMLQTSSGWNANSTNNDGDTATLLYIYILEIGNIIEPFSRHFCHEDDLQVTRRNIKFRPENLKSDCWLKFTNHAWDLYKQYQDEDGLSLSKLHKITY